MKPCKKNILRQQLNYPLNQAPPPPPESAISDQKCKLVSVWAKEDQLLCRVLVLGVSFFVFHLHFSDWHQSLLFLESSWVGDPVDSSHKPSESNLTHAHHCSSPVKTINSKFPLKSHTFGTFLLQTLIAITKYRHLLSLILLITSHSIT